MFYIFFALLFRNTLQHATLVLLSLTKANTKFNFFYIFYYFPWPELFGSFYSVSELCFSRAHITPTTHYLLYACLILYSSSHSALPAKKSIIFIVWASADWRWKFPIFFFLTFCVIQYPTEEGWTNKLETDRCERKQ